MDPQVLQRLEQGEPAVFEQLVAALTGTDNAARKTAEELYRSLLENRTDVTLKLLTAGLSHPTSDMKSFCTVMLRKAVKQDGLFQGCGPDTKEFVKAEVMKQIAAQSNKSIMTKLCDVASELASTTWETPDRWSDILTHMQQFIASQQDHLMQAALLIFSNLVLYLDDEVQMRGGTMYAVLQQCLKHNNVAVQLAATQAAQNFIMSQVEGAEQARYHDLVRSMLDVCGKCLADNNEDDARDVLHNFGELAEAEPRLFKPHLRDFATAMLQIIENPDMEDDTKQAALELMILLVENRPALIRNNPTLLASLCQVCMNMLLELEDTPEWHSSVDEQDAEDGQGMLHEYGQECLDRMAKPIGGKAFMAVLTPIVQAWAVDADWKKRQAVLISIAQVAEGCRKVMLNDTMLASIMQLCCHAVNDPHARVKWAACQAIGQVCTDLAQKVQRVHHGDMMAALLKLMGPQEEPRVQAHSAAAVVNFSDGLDSAIVSLYAAQLTERLLHLLATGNKLVQEGALTAISSVADSCQDLFTDYYDRVMPLLKQILDQATHKSQRRMRGKALECISLIGMAVGKERFKEDAKDFLNALLVLHRTQMDADDPMLSYMQSAGTRMCKCLGMDFVPMLGAFMPALLESASKKPTFETFDADEAPEDDEDYTSVPMGDKVLRINTSMNEEKLNAFNMLCCYAEELREAFFPYCAQVAGIACSSMTLTMFYDEDIRRTAAMVMPPLLSCAQLAAQKASHPEATPAMVQELYSQLWTSLLKAIKAEQFPDVLEGLVESLEQIVDLADPGLVTLAHAQEALGALSEQLDKLEENKGARDTERAAGDFDDEDAERLAEEVEADQDAMAQLVSCLGAFLRKFGDAALPLVEPMLAKHFSGMLTEAGRTEDERWNALMLVTDVVEYAPSAAKFLPQILPKLVEYAGSKNTKCCNAAVYGIGVVAETHPVVYAANHPAIIKALCEMIARVEAADDEDWEHARDNGVAALGKILAAHPDLTAGEAGAQLAASWLACLPLYADTIEGAKQHALLHQFLLKNDQRVLGKDNVNLMRIAEVFVRVISKGDELLDEDNATAFIAFFVRELKPILEARGFNLDAAYAQLDPLDQATFQKAIHSGLIQ